MQPALLGGGGGGMGGGPPPGFFFFLIDPYLIFMTYSKDVFPGNFGSKSSFVFEITFKKGMVYNRSRDARLPGPCPIRGELEGRGGESMHTRCISQ